MVFPRHEVYLCTGWFDTVSQASPTGGLSLLDGPLSFGVGYAIYAG